MDWLLSGLRSDHDILNNTGGACAPYFSQAILKKDIVDGLSMCVILQSADTGTSWDALES